MSIALKQNYPTYSLEQKYQELYISGSAKLGKFANIFTGKDPRDTALILASSLTSIIVTTISALIWLGSSNIKPLYVLILTPAILLLIDSLITLHGNDSLSLKTIRFLTIYLGWKDQGASKVPATAVLSNDLIGKKAKKYLKRQNLASEEIETFYVLIAEWEGNLDSLVTLCKTL